MERLRARFLAQPLDVVLHPMPSEDEKTQPRRPAADTQLPAVSAQEWLERGFRRDTQDLSGKIADYTEAIRLDPTLAVAYNNRGDALAAKGEHDRAIQDYDRAVAINPAYAEAYNRRGVAHEAKGDRERAIADFKSAAAIDGNQVSRDALKRLGANP